LWLKAEVRDEFDGQEKIKAAGWVMKYIASQYVELMDYADEADRIINDNSITFAEKLEKLQAHSAKKWLQKFKLDTLKSMGKVIWLEDNPKITIIQNSVPKFDSEQVLI